MESQTESQNKQLAENQEIGDCADCNTDIAAARTIERDISLTEYEEDRDAILMAVKKALRTYEYKEAQSIIYKYRAAVKTDEQFAILARMTSRGLENQSKIDSIVTVLEATPEDDVSTRIALYRRILDLQPNSRKYRDEYERCRALCKDLPQCKTDAVSKNDGSESSDLIKTMKTIGIVILIVLAIFLLIRARVWMLLFKL